MNRLIEESIQELQLRWAISLFLRPRLFGVSSTATRGLVWCQPRGEFSGVR